MWRAVGIGALLLAGVPALAQVRQPGAMTTIPSSTPQEFDVLDKTGAWVPFGTINGGQFIPSNLPVVPPIPPIPVVASNAALQALPSTYAPAVLRLGYALAGDTPPMSFRASSSPCPAPDGGSQFPSADGKCWIWSPPASGVAPTAFGAKGDGAANDLGPVQAAIDATSAAHVPLLWDDGHLYYTPGVLNVAKPFVFKGPYGLGAWTTTADGSDDGLCHWGVKAVQTGGASQTLFNISALTGTFGPLCMQMAASGANATAGAAISLAPPDASHFVSGVLIDRPYIYGPWDGIALNGNGFTSACCGKGTAANVIQILFPMIVNPVHEGISLGANTAQASTVGITAYDTSILCRNSASQATGKGIVVHDGAITLINSNNGPLGCAYGVVLNPGKPDGTHPQNAQVNAQGVLCDQCRVNALLIQPAADPGEISFSTFVGCWATPSDATKTAVLISNLNGGLVHGLKFSACDFHTWTGASAPLVDIEGVGARAMSDITFTGNHFTLWGGGAFTGPMVRINGTGSGESRNITFTGNLFTTDPGWGGDQTGAWAIDIVHSGAGAPAFESIVGNNFNFPDTVSPVHYTPVSGSDRMLIGENVGVTDVSKQYASAATVTLTASDQNVVLTGTTSVTSLNFPWAERSVTLMTNDAGLTLMPGGAWPFCVATPLASKKLIHAKWNVYLACWATGS